MKRGGRERGLGTERSISSDAWVRRFWGNVKWSETNSTVNAMTQR